MFPGLGQLVSAKTAMQVAGLHSRYDVWVLFAPPDEVDVTLALDGAADVVRYHADRLVACHRLELLAGLRVSSNRHW